MDPKRQRGLGTAEYDSRIDLALDADDNIIIAGTARAKIDFDGGAICDEGLVKLDTAGEHVFSRCSATRHHDRRP